MIGQNVNMLTPEPFKIEDDSYLRRYLNTGQAKIIGIGRKVEGQRPAGNIFPVPFERNENSELAAAAKSGMDPDRPGELVIEAIIGNKLYVMTQDTEPHMVEDRNANIMAAFDEVGLRKS